MEIILSEFPGIIITKTIFMITERRLQFELFEDVHSKDPLYKVDLLSYNLSFEISRVSSC